MRPTVWDHNYNTSAILARGEVNIDYEDRTRFYYELVDDNDDQDRYPDWQRINESIDLSVFPGLDENVDFVSDFNQNDSEDLPNLVPDYDGAFSALFYGPTRVPIWHRYEQQYLGWTDSKTTMEADFPYDRDLSGYNLYAGVNITPEMRLTVGRTDETLIAGDGENTTHYLLFTLEKDYPGLGRVRIF